MKFSNSLIVAVSAAGVCLTLGTAAKAHDITPFLCGAGTDAKSGYVNISGSMVNALSTQAAGSTIPGFTMTNIDSGNTIGTNSLIVTVFGTPNPTNGPYVFISAHDSQSQPLSGVALVSKGKVVGRSSSYTTYSLSNTVFSLPKGVVVDEIVMQIFPSSKAFTSKLYPRFNGATFTKSTKAVSECPGGAHP